MNLHRRKSLRQVLQASIAAQTLQWVGWMTLLMPLAKAGNQAEEVLSDSVRTALSQAVQQSGPPDPVLPTAQAKQQFNAWRSATSRILSKWMDHPDDRQEFLNTLWYEARRAGLSLSLVLGLIEVESAFRKYAISSAGARGFMQVMPFWVRSIGDGNESALFHTQTQLRFGCVILRHMLERENGNLFFALGRYNGSRGQAAYPQAVLAAQKKWLQPVD
ncbi:lytic transglycosylase domain-containing protein [Limnohabitans sp. 103DPR2]|jgi:soluble lytic murein transglycosylase-like protein|uniref:lytic transglycosylase domain-containing protein n=1 Tax=Limnohabitans sp. 103DPR2 TaxID=1678129 RepID=UPI0006DD1140|nr:lytic transglycosylase domain-containing protein [Limnohabitans sp. 103DPR2]ALK91192.1 Membrane-bound lytic murein transglycosylase C [Limnohabitans sp. 103DPR2]